MNFYSMFDSLLYLLHAAVFIVYLLTLEFGKGAR